MTTGFQFWKDVLWECRGVLIVANIGAWIAIAILAKIVADRRPETRFAYYVGRIERFGRDFLSSLDEKPSRSGGGLPPTLPDSAVRDIYRIARGGTDIPPPLRRVK